MVLPLVPVTATTGMRGLIVLGGPPARSPDGRGGPSYEGVEVAVVRRGQPVEDAGDLAAERRGAVAVPPGVGDDDPVHVGRRPHPHREPAGARLACHLPHQPRDGTRREALPEPGAGGTGPSGPQPDPSENRRATSSVASTSAVRSSVSLTAARGK